MILMIDNYDSFTYNLVQYIEELGYRVETYRNDQLSVEKIRELSPEKIVISPGPCTPNEAGISLNVVSELHKEYPMLGVCLGHQSIAQSFGAKVVRAENIMHGKTSPVNHDGKTIFQGIENPFTATRYHSLIVEPASLPECLEVSAKTDDGEIMGLRHKEFAVEAIQFHPESILTTVGKDVLANFLKGD